MGACPLNRLYSRVSPIYDARAAQKPTLNGMFRTIIRHFSKFTRFAGMVDKRRAKRPGMASISRTILEK